MKSTKSVSRRSGTPLTDGPDRAWVWPVGTDWNEALGELRHQSWILDLESFVRDRRSNGPVFPAAENVFRALFETPLAKVKFVVLGQDPYHDVGQAHGLSFSVPPEMKHPPSLRNILREWSEDTGNALPKNGDLTPWTQQGGLLLNTVLTVDAHCAHSHRRQGWEAFTDRIISIVSEQCEQVAFVLWGQPAQKKKTLIDSARHLIVESPHPSPLSAHRGFFGRKPFSRINEWRSQLGLSAIDWRL